MPNETLLAQIRDLSIAEKLEAIDALWVEASRELEAASLTEGEKQFLDERLEHAQIHRDKAVDWQDLRSDILAGK